MGVAIDPPPALTRRSVFDYITDRLGDILIAALLSGAIAAVIQCVLLFQIARDVAQANVQRTAVLKMAQDAHAKADTALEAVRRR